jgi:hypothetical protein
MGKPKEYRVSPGVAFREIEGEMLLIHPETGELFVINESGKLIWEAINRGEDHIKIISQLIEAYETEDTQAINLDVTAFLDTLIASKFITVANSK